jgi:hypothetical protein
MATGSPIRSVTIKIILLEVLKETTDRIIDAELIKHKERGLQ